MYADTRDCTGGAAGRGLVPRRGVLTTKGGSRARSQGLGGYVEEPFATVNFAEFLFHALR